MTYPSSEHQISQPNTQKHKTASWMLSAWAFKPVTWITNRFTLQKKIFLGYAVALTIAVGGSGFGLSVGNYWVYQANQQRKDIRQELRLLNNLLNTTLSLQMISEVYPYLQKPQEFQQAIRRINDLNKLLTEVNTSASEKFQQKLSAYNDTLEQFTQDSKNTLKQIESNQLESQKAEVKRLTANLVSRDSRIKTQNFISDLQVFVESLQEQEYKAEVNFSQAQILRLIISIISMILSLTLAFIIAIYSSRMIAKPISRVTDITEKALEEANYDLELSVSGNIETRKLVTCVNQLFALTKTYIQKQEEAKIAIDAASYAKSEFMANMSHELRTPLNGILGYIQIIQNSPNLSKKERRGIEIIHRCSKHLLTLINDILDFSKIEAHQIKLHPSDFHLPSFLQGIVEICRIKTEQKGLMFIYQTPKNLPSGIHVDKRRLRQVLINLLSNGIKFTETGCVTLQVEVLEIQKEHFSEKVRLLFHIEDTGIGMKPEAISKIFLPFEQLSTTKNKSEGTGLGLALSQKIIEMMNSKIRVKSQLDMGSVFQFEIECPIADDWTESSSITRTGRIMGYMGDKKQILIVDDRWENRSLFINLLSSIGFYLIEAENGKDGLEKAIKHKPDLIIADIKMPIMNGWEMLKEIRQLDEFQNTLFFFCSVMTSDRNHRQAMQAGANYFLNKPVKSKELYRVLAQQLNITWRYRADENIKPTLSKALPKNQLIIPPISELTMLLDFAKQGKIKGIKTELDRIAKINPQYQQFVSELESFAKSFNINKIRQFLQENIK